MPDLLTDEEVGLTEELTDAEVGLGPSRAEPDTMPDYFPERTVISPTGVPMRVRLPRDPMQSLVELPTAIAPKAEGEVTLSSPIGVPFKVPKQLAEQAGAALYNVAKPVVEFPFSPAGAAAAALPETALGRAIVQGTFGGLAAKGGGEALGEASATGDTQRALEGGLMLGAAPFMAKPGTRVPTIPRWQGPLAKGELLRMAEGAKPSPATEAVAAVGVPLEGEPTAKLSPTAEAAVSDIIAKAEPVLPKAAKAANQEAALTEVQKAEEQARLDAELEQEPAAEPKPAERKTWEKKLPPVAKGYVRLYRGGPYNQEGLWFSDNPEVAEFHFTNWKGQGAATLAYIDVPEADAVTYQEAAFSHPDVVSKKTIAEGGDHVLPPELAAQAKWIKGAKPPPPAAEPKPEPAPSAKGEKAQPWYASFGEETKQNIFAVMRKIQERVDAGAERERALRPRQGEIAAGATGFDEFVRSEAQAQVLRAVRKGMTPDQAGAEAKAWAREAVAIHNKKRPKDYNWARDEGTADTTIERAVEELNEVAKPTPTPSPPAASPGQPADQFGAVYGPKLSPDQIARFKEQEGESFDLPVPSDAPPGTKLVLKVKANKLWMEASHPESPGSSLHNTGVAYMHIEPDGTTVLNASPHGRAIDKLAADSLIQFLVKTKGEKPAQPATPKLLPEPTPAPSPPAAKGKVEGEMRADTKQLEQKMDDLRAARDAQVKDSARWKKLNAQYQTAHKRWLEAAHKDVETLLADPPEAPTGAATKAQAEVQKVARTEGQRTAKEIKSELVMRLEKAIEDAPYEADVEEKTATKVSGETYVTQPEQRTKVTIDIPGDGVFTIWNTKEALSEVLKRAKKISTSSESKASLPRGAVAASERALQKSEEARLEQAKAVSQGLREKGRVAMTDAINKNTSEGIVAYREMELDPATDQKRMQEWRIRKTTEKEQAENWKRERREIRWVIESRIVKFDEQGKRQEGEWGFSTQGKTRADAIRSAEHDTIPPESLLVDEGLKNWRHLEEGTGPFSYITEGKPTPPPAEPGMAGPEPPMVGPGAKTVGEPPYPAISQLTDRLKATPAVGLKDKISIGDRVAEQWAKGKSQATRALAKLRSVSESLKETAIGVRDITSLDRRVGQFDWAIQSSAGRSREAGREIKRQMRSQTTREAVALWIDAGGNEKLLRSALDQVPAGTRPSIRRALEEATNLSPEAKQFAEDLRQFYGVREQDAMSHELFEQGLRDYYTHVWEKEENMPDDLRAAYVNGKLSTYFPYGRERKIPTFIKGILAGKKPVLDPAKVIPFYNYVMDRAIASRQFIKDASEVVMPDGRPLLSPSGLRSVVKKGDTPDALLIRPKARAEENADYHQVDHPALRKWKWAGKGESGEPIFYQGDLLVHPEGFTRLANMMDRGRLTPSKWGGRLLTASTEVKGFKLGLLSAFHNVHVASHAAFHWTNPFKALGKPIDWDAPFTQFAVEKGHLKIGPDPSELRIAAEGIMGPGLVHKIPLLGPLSKAWSEWTFGEMIPQLKLATFENAYKRNIWARDHLPLSGLKGFTDEQIAARVGDSVNNAFGELNHLFLGKHGRNPAFQRVLRGIFLAPDFGEARLRFVEKAFTKGGFEERLALATMFTTLYLGARVANWLSHGDPEWDWKRAFAVKAGEHWWSMRSVVGDLDHAMADFGRFMYVRLNPLYSRTIADFLFGRDVSGRRLSARDKIANIFKQLVPIQAQGLTRPDQQVWESFVTAMGLSTQRDRPERDISRLVSQWMSKSTDPRIQQKYQQREGEVFAQSVYAPIRFALENEDYGKAREEYDKLLKIRRPGQVREALYQNIKTMGGLTIPEFARFQKSLTPQQRKLLDQARQHRRELYQRFQRMLLRKE